MIAHLPNPTPGAPQPPLRPVEVPTPPDKIGPSIPEVPPEPDETPPLPTAPRYPEPGRGRRTDARVGR